MHVCGSDPQVGPTTTQSFLTNTALFLCIAESVWVVMNESVSDHNDASYPVAMVLSAAKVAATRSPWLPLHSTVLIIFASWGIEEGSRLFSAESSHLNYLSWQEVDKSLGSPNLLDGDILGWQEMTGAELQAPRRAPERLIPEPATLAGCFHFH